MISVNSPTAFCFSFKNVYFTLQNTITTNLVFPCLGSFFSHVSVHDQSMNQCFLKYVLSPKDLRHCRLQRGEEEESSFFPLDSWMSVWELEKWYHKSFLKQLPLSPLYCSSTNVGRSAPTQALINASVSSLQAPLSKLIKILLPVYAHYFPFGCIMGCCISGK